MYTFKLIGKHNVELTNHEVLSWSFMNFERKNLVPFAINPMDITMEMKIDLNRLDEKAINIFPRWAQERYPRYEIIDKEWFHIIEIADFKSDYNIRRYTFPQAYLINYREDYGDNDNHTATIIIGQLRNLPQNVRINKCWIDFEAEDAAWEKERSQPMPSAFLVTGVAALPNAIKKIAPQAKNFLERAMKNIGLPFNLTRTQTKGVQKQLERIANGAFYVGSTTIKHEDAQRLIEELKRTGGMVVDPSTGKYVLREGAIGETALQNLRNSAHGIRTIFSREYPGDDPSVSPGEGFEWRGRGTPKSGLGNWYNPRTGERLNPDLNHPPPIGPHWDYTDKDGNHSRIYPDGTVVPKKR